MENYYTTLGVDRNATGEEIKKAYRRLAHQHHPDKAGGDEEKFKEVNAAYQVLSDKQKRAQYDQFGQTFDSTGGGGGPFAGGFNVNMDDFGDLGSIFEQFFGGARGRSTPARGRDIQVDLTIDFSESANGISKDITHRLHQTCSRCRGNKAEPGTPIKKCSRCQGQGVISKNRSTVLGVFAHSTPCPDCQGEGSKITSPCTQCRGTGRELKDRTLSIAVPAGIADGQTIRLSGKGEVPATSGQPGDLFVTIHVRPHSSLRRDGDNVTCTVDISFVDAALGTTVTIETLSGPRDINVSPGSQPNDTINLPNLGFPSLSDSRRGDQVVTLHVTIPKKLSRPQKKLLEQYRQTKPRKTLFS